MLDNRLTARGCMKTVFTSLFVLGTLAAISAHDVKRDPPLIVHEWGTITTRHAPDGTPAGRLNRTENREELPKFVYRYDPPGASNRADKSLIKTPLTAGRPDVTMRLETPVMYFYRHPGSAPPAPFDVNVK